MMEQRIEWTGRTSAVDETDLRVARLSALAITAFGRQDKAMRWLHRPSRELGGISPLEMMETEAGARQIESLLHGIAQDHGG